MERTNNDLVDASRRAMATIEARKAEVDAAYKALLVLMGTSGDVLMEISDAYSRKAQEVTDAPSVRFFGSLSLACQAIGQGMKG